MVSWEDSIQTPYNFRQRDKRDVYWKYVQTFQIGPEQIRFLLLGSPTTPSNKSTVYIYIFFIFLKVKIAKIMPNINLQFVFPKKVTHHLIPCFRPTKKYDKWKFRHFFPSPPKQSHPTTRNPCCFFLLAPYLAPFLHGNQCIWSNTEVVIQQTSGLQSNRIQTPESLCKDGGASNKTPFETCLFLQEFVRGFLGKKKNNTHLNKTRHINCQDAIVCFQSGLGSNSL